MHTRSIHNFEEVIMFELQKQLQAGKMRPELTFGQIVAACRIAGRNFTIPIDVDRNSKVFFAKIFEHLNNMKISEWVTVYESTAGRVESVALTNHGVEFLNNIIFTGQEVLR